jgi:hypothetical protein
MHWSPQVRKRIVAASIVALIFFGLNSPNFISAGRIAWWEMVEEFAVAVLAGLIYAAVMRSDGRP